MDVAIIDFSWYGNDFDPASDALLRQAFQQRAMDAEILSWSRGRRPPAPAERAWLRYDVRHPDDLAWAVECALRLRHEGVRVFPSAEALLAAEDKWVTALAFRKASIPIPPTRLANDLPDGPFPMILKPRVGWGAENNRVIFSAADPGTTDATSNAFVVQPFIPHERTLIAAVAAGRPIVCIEPTGGGVRPVVRASVVPFPERAVDLATRALAAVDLITGTVDLIETPDGLRVLEVNSAPQLTYPHLPGCDLAGPMVEAVVSERRQGI